MNKGVLAFLMAGVGIGVALSKMMMVQSTPKISRPEPRKLEIHTPALSRGHRLADRLTGFLEVERN